MTLPIVHPKLPALDRDAVERRVRHVVADRLGVDADDLGDEVSLVDDLAADSLELVEIAVAIEEELGVVLPRRLLDGVRTCCDLVEAAMVDLGRTQRAVPSAAHTPAHGGLPLVVRARVSTPGASLERIVTITPYALETIFEDALRAGDGARLELTVPAATSGAELATLAKRFARLDERGVRFTVHREFALGSRAA
jgi:acyl carrier protein